MIDTHCHIHDFSTYTFAAERQKCNPNDFTPDKLLKRSLEQGITGLICVGTSHDDSLVAQKFATKHVGRNKHIGQNVFWSYGIHPDEANNHTKHPGIKPAPENPPVAIGEVGLDYHNGSKNRDAQIRLLEQMLDLANSLNLPLIFHIRDAFDDFFPVVDNFHVRAVVHSFSDSPENLEKALVRDFYIGVNGLATFAHDLPIAQIPLDRLLLETDAPFLTPAPNRNKVNEPFYVKDTAAFLATLHDQPIDKIISHSDQNAKTLFNF